MFQDFLHLFFPKYCLACRGSVPKNSHLLCSTCAVQLPRTDYHKDDENPIQQKFEGLLPIKYGIGYLHFAKGGTVQRLLHQLKYENHPEVGEVLGHWYGHELKEYGMAEGWDLILPIPLHVKKMRKRGYNQSDAIAQGVALGTGLPWSANLLARTKATDTQTKRNRAQRYQNMAHVFKVTQPPELAGKRVLLVDDVVTTGATLQACGEAILHAGAKDLSIATLAVAQ